MGRPLDAAQVERVRTTVLSGTQDFAASWLDAGRVAVPIDETVELDTPFAQRIAEALAAHGGTGWGVLGQSWPGYREPDGQVLDADAAAVAQFHFDMAPVDMVITTPTLQFAVLFGQDEYGLVGGPRETVEFVLGSTLAAAGAAFDAYAEDMKDAARHLPEVAARYRGRR